jgi:hypothetical protein
MHEVNHMSKRVTFRPRIGPRISVLLIMARMLAALPALGAVVNLNPAQDNMMVQENGTLSSGAGSWVIAGTNNQGTLGDSRRALIRFDLTGVPTNATITGITLTMTNDRGKVGSQAVTLHRATASWGEGTSNSDADPGKGAPATTNDATWTHRLYPTTTWTTPGGDFVGSVSASTPVGNSGTYTWASALMIADVQQWVSTPATNFGWIVIGNEALKATARRFYSRTGATPPVLQ